MSRISEFPQGFVWGAAAASYQVEGAAYEDGKGLSVWDVFCKKPGAVRAGDTGDVACDQYHRYPDDVQLMKSLGLHAYRLSISWPRVMPFGTKEINPAGLAFYDRLVDALLEAGIQPYVTLFHWDYPYELFCRGGWLNRYSPDWFADYVTVIAKRLGDRVRHWMTLNEPQVVAEMGHHNGGHAPGIKLPLKDVLRVIHHMLLAHGKAVQAIRTETTAQGTQVGYAPVGNGFIPSSDSAEDVDTARKITFSVAGRDSVWGNTWYSDPIFFGRYPEDGVALYGEDMPEIGPQDMDTIAQPLDFYALNNYTGRTVKAGEDGKPIVLPAGIGHARSAVNWPVTPDSLYWAARFLHERYQKPILISENGMANLDWVSLDGQVHDPQRIDYTRRYLLALQRAITEGIPVLGYFHWSILDNFEWAEGYHERFGLVHVDYTNQQRTMKDSARWYSQVIASNGASLQQNP